MTFRLNKVLLFSISVPVQVLENPNIHERFKMIFPVLAFLPHFCTNRNEILSCLLLTQFLDKQSEMSYFRLCMQKMSMSSEPAEQAIRIMITELSIIHCSTFLIPGNVKNVSSLINCIAT